MHYNTVVNTEILYASETLAMVSKGGLRNILKEERNIIRAILEARRTGEGYMLQRRQPLRGSNR